MPHVRRDHQAAKVRFFTDDDNDYEDNDDDDDEQSDDDDDDCLFGGWGGLETYISVFVYLHTYVYLRISMKCCV